VRRSKTSLSIAPGEAAQPGCKRQQPRRRTQHHFGPNHAKNHPSRKAHGGPSLGATTMTRALHRLHERALPRTGAAAPRCCVVFAAGSPPLGDPTGQAASHRTRPRVTRITSGSCQ
jgi:hypothetical protein